MRILIFHSKFSQQSFLKQPWRVTYELSKGLAKQGHKIVIFTDSLNRVEFKDPSIEVKSVDFEYLRFKMNSIKPLLENFDVAFYFGNPLSGTYLSTLKDVNTPLILYISSAPYKPSELQHLSLRELRSHWLHLSLSLPPLRFIISSLLNKNVIARIAVPNDFLRERLIKLGVREHKISVIPIGFDIGEFTINKSDVANEREKLGLPKEDFIITYLGSPSTIRGTDTLIKAIYLLDKWLRKFRVLLLLRVDSEEEVKEEILLRSLIRKLDLSSRFFVTSGILSRERIKEYIHASDLIVLPFKIIQSEPPLSLLESMALGKPIITTKTCGLPELVGIDRGVLVKPSDPNNLALAIYELYQDPQRMIRLGQRAKEFVLGMPNWKYVTSLYESLFKDLVGKGYIKCYR